MKQDKLEEFIQANRSQFDDKEVPPMLWKAIEDDLEPEKGRVFPLKFILSIAASAVVLIAIGLVIGMQMGPQGVDQRIIAVSPEFHEAEQHYRHQVSLKLDEARSIGAEKHVENDLNQLDSVYQELKTELLNNGVQSDEVIVQAIIEHYQSKLEVLEIVLDKLQEKNTTINKSDYENLEL